MSLDFTTAWLCWLLGSGASTFYAPRRPDLALGGRRRQSRCSGDTLKRPTPFSMLFARFPMRRRWPNSASPLFEVQNVSAPPLYPIAQLPGFYSISWLPTSGMTPSVPSHTSRERCDAASIPLPRRHCTLICSVLDMLDVVSDAPARARRVFDAPSVLAAPSNRRTRNPDASPPPPSILQRRHASIIGYLMPFMCFPPHLCRPGLSWLDCHAVAAPMSTFRIPLRNLKFLFEILASHEQRVPVLVAHLSDAPSVPRRRRRASFS
ncbi:hypothetical protein B0H15DRAFT_438743 [Mycena belliarum]|uniref:Secreted protein n=1 Tax=Mycena belliarum TaxID=1033014 RepID=A0AAD6XLE4_9AGAR|nr:hypothetical protein B0H15DRAFT_438743 [Mycena belliae]